MSALTLDRVTFRYPASAVPALVDLSLEVNAGEIVALIGATGSGTSTLLLVAAGLAPRVVGGELTGRVLRDGRAALLLPTPWTQVSGMAFTVWDEVAFGPANLGWPRERISAAVERALTRVDVAGLRDRDPATLSGGELQRVILAGVLAMEPALLLLDEPTAELDPPGVELAWQVLRDIQSEGAAVIVATSDLDALPECADRVVWLSRGQVRQTGPAASLLASPDLWEPDAPGSTAVAGAWQQAALPAPAPLTVRELVARCP